MAKHIPNLSFHIEADRLVCNIAQLPPVHTEKVDIARDVCSDADDVCFAKLCAIDPDISEYHTHGDIAQFRFYNGTAGNVSRVPVIGRWGLYCKLSAIIDVTTSVVGEEGELD
jgi:hypothetical protein